MIGIDKPQKTIEDYLKVAYIKEHKDDDVFETLMRYNVLVEVKEGGNLLHCIIDQRFTYYNYIRDIEETLDSHDYKSRYFLNLEILNKKFLQEVMMIYLRGSDMLLYDTYASKSFHVNNLHMNDRNKLIRKEDMNLIWDKLQEYYGRK